MGLFWSSLRMLCQRLLKTFVRCVRVKKGAVPVGKDYISRAANSIESFQAACVKVVISLKEMGLVASLFTGLSLGMKTLSTNTLGRECFPWPTQDPTQMVLNSFCAQLPLLILMGSMLSSAGLLTAWKLSKQSRSKGLTVGRHGAPSPSRIVARSGKPREIRKESRP